MLVEVQGAFGGVLGIIAKPHCNTHVGKLRHLNWLTTPLSKRIAVFVGNHAKVF